MRAELIQHLVDRVGLNVLIFFNKFFSQCVSRRKTRRKACGIVSGKGVVGTMFAR